MGNVNERYIEPFHSSHIVLVPPRRHSFMVRNFKTFAEAVRLLWSGHKDPSWNRAESHYNEGLRLHSIGSYADAETQYQAALALVPDHEPAHINIAALYCQTNSYELAIDHLRKAIECRPTYPRAYYNMGLVLQLLERIDEAIDSFEAALEQDPNHFWALVCLAEIHVDRNQSDRAIALYQRAIEHTTDDQSIMVRIAEIHFNQGDLAAAKSMLQDAVQRLEHPEIYYNLGCICLKSKEDPDRAAAYFDQALGMRSNYREAMYNYNVALCLAGNYRKSLEIAERYTRAYTKHQVDDRIEHYQRMIAFNPLNDALQLELADLLLHSGRAAQAIEVLEKLTEANPKCLVALEQLGDLYTDLGRPKDAIKTYRRMIAEMPEETAGYLGLTRAFAAVENYKAAIPVIRKVLELEEGHADLHYQYATLMAQEGNFEVALEHYRKVAALNPHYPRIQKRIQMLEEERKDQIASQPQAWPLSQMGK